MLPRNICICVFTLIPCVLAAFIGYRLGFNWLAVEPVKIEEPTKIEAARKRREKKERKRRNVYLDLGANFGNTLRLYRDIGDIAKHPGPWEVYSFEVLPSIAFYVDKLVKHLNGEDPMPVLTVLPTGAAEHSRRYSELCGCKGSVSCIRGRFCKQCDELPFDRTLSNPATINRRLSEAAQPAVGRDRFTFLAAGCGAKPGALYFDPEPSNRSCFVKKGFLCNPHPLLNLSKQSNTSGAIAVPIVDLPYWIHTHFLEDDHIVMKSDIEGAEHAILEGILARNISKLIDTLAIECHPPHKRCNHLLNQIRNQNQKIKIMHEGLLLRLGGYRSPDRSYTEDTERRKIRPVCPKGSRHKGQNITHTNLE